MNMFSRRYRLKFCISFLLFSGMNSGAELVLISVHEYGNVVPQPCVVYEFDQQNNIITEIINIPSDGGIRMARVSPDRRFLAIWKNTKLVAANTSNVIKGKLVVVDLGTMTVQKRNEFPFMMSIGGHFLQDKNDQLLLTARGIRDINNIIFESFIIDVLDGDLQEVQWSLLEWNQALYRGLLIRREQFHFWGKRIKFEIGSNKLSMMRQTDSSTYARDTPFDSNMQELIDHEKLETALLLCADLDIAVFRFAKKRIENQTAVKRHFIFHKDSDTWTPYTPPEGPSEPLLYGEYVVERGHNVVERIQGDRVSEDLFPNGKHTFYTRSGERLFDWQSEPDATILNIIDGRIIYRVETAIKSLPFTQEEGVDEENEETLIEDERLRRVYWALKPFDEMLDQRALKEAGDSTNTILVIIISISMISLVSVVLFLRRREKK